ncbi:hypothetical protein F4820DRAFT_438259 [Hypoxylon rubiginosum]|uniref:Uncharacterized protein n=1 Tax=Hypoxylon rubiginosum TaxID=110542 RepID=A0ACB9YL93_9PEZI|nr:hypothetical protein F4820DRAFT_438259 [Hypoxylon rubiginosum]
MHFSSVIKFATMAAPIFLQSVSGWSFTAYDTEGCVNGTSATSDTVAKSGNVACDPVPHADQHKSIKGGIPADSKCRVDFFPYEGCEDRVAFSLTQDGATTCYSIADFLSPLAYYRATDCA